MSENLWIIDTDAGVDDCQALVLALSSEQTHNFKVLAITGVSGNTGLQQVLSNITEALKVCEKPDIPVHLGASRPLINHRRSGEVIHGIDGLNNYWQLPGKTQDPDPQVSPKHAVQAIIDYATEYSGRVNIVTIGPLTNLALAVCLDSELPSKFNRVLVMGGAVHGKGNISAVAEFNAGVDPEAAYIVFERFPCIEIVPWELCIAPEHKFSPEFLVEYTKGVSKKGEFISEITKFHEDGESRVFFCDPLALCVAIDPSIVLVKGEYEASVELTGTQTRGMTVVNWGASDEPDVRRGTGNKNLQIIQKLDITRAHELLISSIK